MLPGTLWQIYSSKHLALFEDGCHEEIVTEHKLVRHLSPSDVQRVVQEEGPRHRQTCSCRLLDQLLLVTSKLDVLVPKEGEELSGFVVREHLEVEVGFV